MIIKGVVVKGRNLGHKLGFPTANISIDTTTKVENGVYASKVYMRGAEYRAVTNIGMKPTVGGDSRGAESHILNFEGDLYGQEIQVELLTKLRDEKLFGNVEALAEQVKQDIEIVKNLK